MTILDYENTAGTATELWSSSESRTTQSNPVTRRVAIDSLTSELETAAIEGNAEFLATVVERLAVPNPNLIEADDLL